MAKFTCTPLHLDSMSPILLLHKPVGKTPLDCIRDYVSRNPAYEHVSLGYAGRLDPMAEGLLVVLVGDENKNRERYLGLDKEYEVEVLFGVETDTYDVLGLIGETHRVVIERDDIASVLDAFTGEIVQEYPPYSSKTVNGKPLYVWAREGRLGEIQLPSEMRAIRELEIVKCEQRDVSSLRKEIERKLDTLESGDFRVPEIRASWNAYFSDRCDEEVLTVVAFRVVCSSGTYMRSLAHEIGRAVGSCALALSIKRTRVGDFQLSSADR